MRTSRASLSCAALFHEYAALCWSTLQCLPGVPAARGPLRAGRHMTSRPDNDGTSSRPDHQVRCRREPVSDPSLR